MASHGQSPAACGWGGFVLDMDALPERTPRSEAFAFRDCLVTTFYTSPEPMVLHPPFIEDATGFGVRLVQCPVSHNDYGFNQHPMSDAQHNTNLGA